MLDPDEPSALLLTLRRHKHCWFGWPEMFGYAMCLVLFGIGFAAIRPVALPWIASWPVFAVIENVEARNAVQLPSGVVSVDLYRLKIRNGYPKSVVFYISNELTAEGDKGIRVLPYHADDDCKDIGESGGDRMEQHPIGPVISHYCFKLPPQVVPGQDYEVRGEYLHYAWPFYGVVLIRSEVPMFRPKKIAGWPYGTLSGR